MTPPDGHPDPNKWWRHARYMAYASLFGMLGYPLLALAAPAESLGSITWPFYLAVSGVVVAYTGGVALSGRAPK